MDAVQRLLDVAYVEHRAQAHQPGVSVPHGLVDQTAVADLELGVVSLLGPHAPVAQAGGDVGKVPGRHDLLLVVLAVEQLSLGRRRARGVNPPRYVRAGGQLDVLSEKDMSCPILLCPRSN